jgi:hypothetical protein
MISGAGISVLTYWKVYLGEWKEPWDENWEIWLWTFWFEGCSWTPQVSFALCVPGKFTHTHKAFRVLSDLSP